MLILNDYELFDEAVRSDDVQIFLKLLDHYIGTYQNKYQKAFDLAKKHGKVNIARYLIETEKVDPNFIKPRKKSLMEFTGDCDRELFGDRIFYFLRPDGVIQCFIDPVKFCVYAARNSKYSPLEVAIQHYFDRYELMSVVYDHFKSSMKVGYYSSSSKYQNIIYPDGYAALHWAVRTWNFMAVKFLYEEMGSSLYIRSILGTTPLHEAVIGGNTEITEYLYKKIGYVDFEDNDGWTPLHFSAALGDEKNTKMLIENGADLEAKTYNSFLAPLELAEINLHPEIVKLIQRYQICKKSNIFEESVNIDQINRSTYLHLAAKKGDKNMIKYFYEKIKYVDFKDINGWTPLHFAAEGGHIEAVEMLIRRGADLNAKTSDTLLTPLELAKKHHYIEIIDLIKNFQNCEIDDYFFDFEISSTSDASRLFENNILIDAMDFACQIPKLVEKKFDHSDSFTGFSFDSFPSQLMLFMVFRYWVANLFKGAKDSKPSNYNYNESPTLFSSIRKNIQSFVTRSFGFCQ